MSYNVDNRMKRTAKISILFMFLIFVLPSTGICQDYDEVKGVDFYSYSTYTRIAVQIGETTGYVLRDLINPPRILVNLYPANLNIPEREIKVGDGFVEKIRLEQESESIVKLALDLNKDLNQEEYTYDTFILKDKDSSSFVIDVRSSKEDLIATLLKGKGSVTFPSANVTTPSSQMAYKVILDPGHGGKDPGAIGPTGLKESEITLSVAEELKKILEDNLGVKVYLTRSRDRFIPLDERTEIANRLGGDIFVSIHANAGFNRQAKGVETFFNSRYAYGEGAKEVAARENASFASEEVSAGIKKILWDMIQDQYRSESNELSHIVQEELCKATGLEDRGVKSARFYVLRGAAMPAILVEVAFISNPWEERNLKKKNFREKIVRGIFNGLKRYLLEVKK
ncbi:MAG: N-acetylmuramoyl-L-alanine amidase [Candidatus Aerophobetes bacterium]|nr:N-acetylmuramoyl-L-alanine amidase [Candidatus Aerophobetes bacterium]